MKQQLYNLFFTSPLEQFENNSLVFKKSAPVVPELYLNWATNLEYSKMIEVESNYFFEPEYFFYFQDKAAYVIFIALFFFGLGLILNLQNKNSLFNIFNKQLVVSWIVAKAFIFFMTFTSVDFKYFVAYNEIEKTVDALVFPLNNGNFILNDSMCFFITALLFLYLCTAFQDFHSSKGPFIVSKNPLTSIQLSIHKVTVDLLGSSTDKDVHTQSYHAFVYGLFTYLVICNVQGLVPFTITVTSHLICTFFLAQVVMLYVVITILAEKGFNYLLTLFMPSGAPLLLGYLLIPIEIVSFFFKTVSLSVRLFANMMAGHTLLKVILGFAWTILVMSELLFLVNLFPIVILVLLTVLEIGVSVIQAYIFSILTCLYLRDAFAGH